MTTSLHQANYLTFPLPGSKSNNHSNIYFCDMQSLSHKTTVYMWLIHWTCNYSMFSFPVASLYNIKHLRQTASFTEICATIIIWSVRTNEVATFHIDRRALTPRGPLLWFCEACCCWTLLPRPRLLPAILDVLLPCLPTTTTTLHPPAAPLRWLNSCTGTISKPVYVFKGTPHQPAWLWWRETVRLVCKVQATLCCSLDLSVLSLWGLSLSTCGNTEPCSNRMVQWYTMCCLQHCVARSRSS